jgi:uncharacterized peroxidase-related enzyme
MQRIPALDPETATGPAKELMGAVKAKLGGVPNVLRTLANGPAALQAYLGISGALAAGTLSARLRECVALAIGQQNDCDYCLAAHTAFGGKAGLSQEEMMVCRHGEASDPQASAAIRFCRRVADTRGFVTDEDLADARHAGFNDGQIAELVAVVALNLFTNYFNHVADTELDFPPAPPLS